MKNLVYSLFAIILVFPILSESRQQIPFGFFKQQSAACAGAVVGGYCWYQGAVTQSCDTVCATHGGYNSATQSYGGASQANCAAIFTAMGTAYGTVNGPAVYFGSYDCTKSTANNNLFVSTLTGSSSSSGAFVIRACACSN